MSTTFCDHIELQPGVLAGKPVLKGTRLAVDLVLEMLAEGVTEEKMLANYPRLTRQGVIAGRLAFGMVAVTHLRTRAPVTPCSPVTGSTARKRILAQKDPSRLELWHERAIVAASVSEVLAKPRKAA